MRRRTFNPGALKIPVSVIRSVARENEDHISIMEDEVIYQTRGRVFAVKPKQFGKNNPYESEIEDMLVIRKPRHLDINEEDKFLIKGKRYFVVWIDNVEEEDRYLQIQIKAWNKGENS
ncbi:hypothetical protein [Cetobacterium sp.]|uniref:hypothetical protein n=1 Tax=Cetobacterium sp. TaxID=2071632 RepID=UPI003EE73738